MYTHDLWVFVHILLFVYWLGADLGVLLLARRVKDGTLSFETRATLLQMATLIDLTPRLAFVLMLPVGLEMAWGLGLLPEPGAWRWLIWGVAGVWLWSVIHAGRNPASPLSARLQVLQRGWTVVLGVATLAAGIAFMAGIGGAGPAWLGGKLLMYGLICAFAIGIDWAFHPIVGAFGRLASEGSSPEVEQTIGGSIDKAIVFVLALYAALLVAAFLGTTQPV
jgi:hypothetical protein